MQYQQGRTYVGRRLPRPDEDVVDQGAAFDVATVLGRRQVLRVLGLGAVTVGLAACGASTSSSGSTTTAASAAGLAEIPDETAGPYPGDGSNGPDVLEQSGIVRSDIRSSFGTAGGTAQGVPMQLELVIKDLADGGGGFEGVRDVHVGALAVHTGQFRRRARRDAGPARSPRPRRSTWRSHRLPRRPVER